VGSGEEALRTVESSSVDVMLLDVQMPGIGGLEVLRQVREKHTDIGVIMISVLKDVPVAVEAMRLGALDYVTKDFSPPELNARVAKTLDQLKAARELAWLREEQASRDQKPMVLGKTQAMRNVALVVSPPSPSRCSSPARAAPARRCSPATSTITPTGAAGLLWR
jgi:DNA-binding NtrC family response regulator